MADPPKPPAFADLAEPVGPVFLRKMNRKIDWGNDDMPPEERAADIIGLVFDGKTHPFSVYLVGSDRDLEAIP